MLRETSSSRHTLTRYGLIDLLVLTTVLLLKTAAADAVPPGNNRPFRVVDRNGSFVGYTITENLVAREIDGNWVTFYVHTGLGVFDSNAIYVFFANENCSGQRYIPHYSTFAEGTRVGPLLYYPSDQRELSPRSLRVEYGSGESGPCLPGSSLTGVYGAVATVTVDSFRLELPFRAVQ